MSFDLGDYVDVKTRIVQFWDRYPDGRIICEHPTPVEIDGRWYIASHVLVYTGVDDNQPAATGSAWEQWPGRTPYTKDSEAMNAETSAVGRALGNLGIGIAGSIATADEVRNRRAEQAPISDNDRRDVQAAIAALSDPAKARLKVLWKDRKIRKLENLTAADLDAVHELIVEVEESDDPATQFSDDGQPDENGGAAA